MEGPNRVLEKHRDHSSFGLLHIKEENFSKASQERQTINSKAVSEQKVIAVSWLLFIFQIPVISQSLKLFPIINEKSRTHFHMFSILI